MQIITKKKKDSALPAQQVRKAQQMARFSTSFYSSH
jgi:hypothetical protein